jgi:hypothetical protein
MKTDEGLDAFQLMFMSASKPNPSPTGVVFLDVQSRSVTDDAFYEAKADLERLQKLSDDEEWDKDPYSILATKMFGIALEEVTVERRKLAKAAFLKCAVSIDPGWGASL